MKVELYFLNDFNCAYNSSLPICSYESDREIGTCKISVQDNKYFGDLQFTNVNDIHEDYYLWCKWHIAENELVTVDQLYLTKEPMDSNFSVQLKDAALHVDSD